MLGQAYPGYYPVKDAKALRERLLQAESDKGYYAVLEAACAEQRHQFMPQQEHAGWQKLLSEIQASRAR